MNIQIKGGFSSKTYAPTRATDKDPSLEDRVLSYIKVHGEDVSHARIAADLGATEAEVAAVSLTLAVRGAY